MTSGGNSDVHEEMKSTRNNKFMWENIKVDFLISLKYILLHKAKVITMYYRFVACVCTRDEWGYIETYTVARFSYFMRSSTTLTLNRLCEDKNLCCNP